MDSSTGSRSSFDISAARRLGTALVSLALLVPLARLPAQSLDSTVEEQVQEQIESDVTTSVEDEVQDSVESDVTGSVEDAVESDVTSTVEDEVQQTVESDVAGAVEDSVQETVESDVTSSVEDQVETTVESDVTSSVEDQVESDVAGSVEDEVRQTVESDVASTVEDSVQRTVESDVADAVESEVESGLTDTIDAALAGRVTAIVEREIGPALTDRLGDDLDDALEQLIELVDELEIDDVDAALEQAIEFASEDRTATDAGEGADAESGEGDGGEGSDTEPFSAGVDARGRGIESEVWVVLVPDAYAARIPGWGFEVRERRELAGLDRVFLRIDAPEDRDIAQAALELALDAPGTSVDFNHFYSAEAGQSAEGAATRPAGAAGRLEPRPKAPASAGLALGIVDSRVAIDHEALARARISARDFVAFDGARPTAHGTAVASILVGESTRARGVVAGASLHAASVFFETEAGEQIATTDALVSALEWLVEAGVDVVNMSLSGPPNRVLETAITETTAREVVVVAAVGNNGPAGEPLYPAAYSSVVGVTAVDASHRVYRYASRGREVMFSAPGVDVRVAGGEGGYTERSGTSMAAPHATAEIARALNGRAGLSVAAVLERLRRSALDLGAPEFDEIFGHGLIAAVD